MGIRGHVWVKPPEYGECVLSSWVAGQCSRLMNEHDVTVYEYSGQDADKWEVEINYCLEEFMEKLRKNPKMLDDLLGDEMKGQGYGNSLLSLLDEGLEAAKNNGDYFIIIEWF